MNAQEDFHSALRHTRPSVSPEVSILPGLSASFLSQYQKVHNISLQALWIRCFACRTCECTLAGPSNLDWRVAKSYPLISIRSLRCTRYVSVNAATQPFLFFKAAYLSSCVESTVPIHTSEFPYSLNFSIRTSGSTVLCTCTLSRQQLKAQWARMSSRPIRPVTCMENL